ncbi:MAG: TrkH family potassium uptake protein [Clostridiales bacterium]|nr:TrkH family potassium uptake protein [Clostridiales bacterium]
MNYRSIINILGWITGIEGVFMLLPLVCALVYGERTGVFFALCAAGCFLVCLGLTRVKRRKDRFYAREGYVTVALAWILMSLIGALPFTLSGEIPNYLDAVFETVSGFTTTGASILDDVEALSHCMLLWRSFTHWVGGMGVLVFVLAILPLAGGGSSFALMQAESPGPSVSKLVPHLKATARNLYIIYTGLTFAQFVLMCLGGMPLFDSLCIAFGTAGTGGFGVLADSCAAYSTYLQVVITIFMVLFGINFEFFFLCTLRRFREAGKMEEVRWYLIIFVGATLVVGVDVFFKQGGGLLYNLQQSAFQVASVMTTTGFSTCDFDQWPLFARMILVAIMFSGACAGSTGGGLKVSRILLYAKAGIREARALIQPRRVSAVRLNGSSVERSVLQGAMMFLACYLGIYVVSVLLLALDCEDFTTCFTAVAATINNIGPGLSLVGPACNYGFLSPLSKLTLIFDMLAGRLEVFPMLILLFPSTWKRK